MKVRTFSTKELASVYVAAIVENLIQTHPSPVIGLATGSSPVDLYRHLAHFCHQGLSFAQVTTVNLDEYVGVPAHHPQSYHRFMDDHLFRFIDVPPDQIFIPDGTASDLQAACEQFDEILERHPIDLQILGLGHNGHIGFNEPGLALATGTHVTALSPETIAANARFFASPAEVPTHAITMGVQSILRAKKIILLAFGEDKAEAVQRSISGQISTDVPASILQVHPDVTFVLDKLAAALLGGEAVCTWG